MKKKPRKHGLSRLEKLREASIRQELRIKAMRSQLLSLSMRIARLETAGSKNGSQDWFDPSNQQIVSDSSEVWPYRPTFNGQ